MNIAVIGYPYTRQNFRAVFEQLNAYFILPKVWKIKKGKAQYHTKPKPNILTTRAFFYHSDYPIIGGLLKGWMPAFPLLLWRLKREHDVRLVFEAHEPTLLTTLYHGLFTKILGLKHVVFSWENIPFERKFSGVKGVVHRLILQANLALADGVVCGNQRCLDIFRSLTRKPLALIPLAGLDPQQFHLSAPRPVRSEVTFVFAGAIDYRKGLHILLPAFKQLLGAVPQARLIIVGSGTYEAQVEALIDELSLAVTRISWADHAALIGILAKSDVFVYPSIAHGGWEEQFGYSMAEASLLELPVIATRSGSIAEVVRDGTTGILVEPGSVEQLVDALRTLALDPALRRRYGSAGRQFIEHEFSNAVVGSRFTVFFNSLLIS